ncbi:MAG: DNA cytosine methyltransferase [Opitutales bacterium]|nr:DNA cytosine methyltransferase [Opitutales bacterium]
MELASLELCAGAGGQAIGLERAGFACAAAVELDHHACATLRANRPHWEILEQDVRDLDGRAFRLAHQLDRPPTGRRRCPRAGKLRRGLALGAPSPVPPREMPVAKV